MIRDMWQTLELFKWWATAIQVYEMLPAPYALGAEARISIDRAAKRRFSHDEAEAYLAGTEVHEWWIKLEMCTCLLLFAVVPVAAALYGRSARSVWPIVWGVSTFVVSLAARNALSFQADVFMRGRGLQDVVTAAVWPVYLGCAAALVHTLKLADTLPKHVAAYLGRQLEEREHKDEERFAGFDERLSNLTAAVESLLLAVNERTHVPVSAPTAARGRRAAR